MTTFVLVPGAWHQPEIWNLLRGELSALGHDSRAVRLATNGPSARGGLQDDAAAIRESILSVPGPVVVVAHSYGGIPATEGVAGLPGVRHMVYLAAYVPDVEESMFTLHGMPDPASAEGLFPITGDPRAMFYGDVPDELAAEAVDNLVDQRLQPFVDRVTRATWHGVPSTYILTEQDGVLPVALQETMAARTKNVRRLPTSHSPFLSRPAELAALLDEIAAS
jgi:pimeloyl-ACP methyl ester carboxylesterase